MDGTLKEIQELKTSLVHGVEKKKDYLEDHGGVISPLTSTGKYKRKYKKYQEINRALQDNENWLIGLGSLMKAGRDR